MNEVSYIDREKSEIVLENGERIPYACCEYKDCVWWGRCEVKLEDCEMREGIYVCKEYVSDEKIREIAERHKESLKRLSE